MLTFIKRLAKRNWVIGISSVIIAIALLFSGLTINNRAINQKIDSILQGDVSVGSLYKEIIIGTTAEAAGTSDYTCDGIADDAQFQAALNALPNIGGKITVLTGNYVFSATVTRMIDRVTIEGNGLSSNFTYNGVNPIFTAGGNQWVFSNIVTDAGGINLGATTGWLEYNLLLDTTYYAYRSTTGSSVFNNMTVASLTDSGLTNGRIPIAGVGGLLGDSANLTFTGNTLTTSTVNVTGTLWADNITTDSLGSGTANASSYLRGDQTWVTPSWSSNVSYIAGFVAASDATADEIAQAQWECDGTNDEVQISAAEAVGTVILSSGTFSIDDALTLNHGNRVIGQGSGDLAARTNLHINGTDHGILITPSGNYMGSLQDVNIWTDSGFATYALKVQNGGTDIRGRYILGNITVKAYHAGVGEGTPDITAGSIGIDFACTSGFNQNVFENIYITGFEKCMRVYINETGDHYYYMNGNFFNNWTLAFGKYLMYFDINSATGYNQGDFAFNMFTGLILEPSTVQDLTDYGIYAVGTGYGRFWGTHMTQLIIWDCQYIDTKAIYLDNNCPNNYIDGAWTEHFGDAGREAEDTVSDAGSNNTITRHTTNGDIL
jgi:hypothetical protein